MPRGARYASPFLQCMQCNRQGQKSQFHTHDPLYLISFTSKFPHPSVHSIPFHPTPHHTLNTSTNIRLPLTITQTIPPPPTPPKPPSTIPPLRPQSRNRMEIRLRPPTILRHPSLTITSTISRIEIERLGIETAGYTVSGMFCRGVVA